MSQDVCRLCSGTENLCSVFDGEYAENMAEMIEFTTDIKITKSDHVTQMVCRTCCQITIKMYTFRTRSINNDNELKARYADYNVSQMKSTNVKNVTPKSKPTTSKGPSSKYRNAHFSVKELVQQYPSIILPSNCLNSHVGAYITLISDEVDDWFKEKQYSDSDIARIKQEALELSEPKKKRSRDSDSETRVEKNDAIEKEKNIENIRPISPTNQVKRVKLISNITCKEGVGPNTKESVETQLLNMKKIMSAKLNSGSVINNNPSEVSDSVIKSSEVGNSVPENKDQSEVNSNSPSSGKNIVIRKALESIPKTVSSDSSVSTNTKTKSDNDISKRPILKTYLQQRTKPRKRKISEDSEEITLKSLLGGQKDIKSRKRPVIQDSDDDDDVIEVRDDSTSVAKPAEQEFELFTSRPFLNVCNKISNKEAPQEVTSGNASKESDSGSDTITTDDTSRSSSLSPILDDLLDFVHSVKKPNNQPDLSLVSVRDKTYTLYTCRVCDSQHTSLKGLKIHERKTHTKCPFCSQRFRSLMDRETHVSTSCSLNQTLNSLKIVKLELIRVDEIEAIRTKYRSAFEPVSEIEQDENTPTETDVTKASESDPVKDLEAFINSAETVPVSDNTNSTVIEDNTEKTDCNNERTTVILQNKAARPSTKDNDVICISDDETEKEMERTIDHLLQAIHPKETALKKSPKMINVVNREILCNPQAHCSDLDMLRNILRKARQEKIDSQHMKALEIRNFPILEGNNNKALILKELKPYLEKHRVMIEVSCGPNLSVEYKPKKAGCGPRSRNLWKNLVPLELKPTKNNPKVLNGQLGLGNPMPPEKNVVMKPMAPPNVTVMKPMAPPNVTVMNKTIAPKTTTANYILPKNIINVLNKPSENVPVTNGIPTVNNGMNIANFILVPNNFLKTPPPLAAMTTLPVIRSVSGGIVPTTTGPSATTVATLESITNSLMPNGPKQASSTTGNEVRVASNANVTKSTTGNEVRVASNANVTKSTTGNKVRVASNANVTKSTTGNEVRVASNAAAVTRMKPPQPPPSTNSTFQQVIRVKNLKELS